ncbi:MAG TPA: type I 3-dehydroquinate dehydratase [Syntrophales bacterium]|nr:type I 3-dehydroquinate dehydratase [Syntrophobacterales bacterium]HQL90163.1 type I 3-dehydroquinate dehydratase [Syntrophales bacterium]
MICISVVPATNEEALSLLGRALPLADLVELRIDRIEAPELPVLLYAGRDRIVVTNRRRDEGGFFAGCEARRLDLLHEAVELGARLVDVEQRTGEKAVGRLADAVRSRGGRTGLIVSHHDPAGTPSAKTLAGRLKACRALGADVVKIVTFANRTEDNLRILELLPLARQMGQDTIAFCMGEKGRLSRVAAPLLGSRWSYASLEKGTASAPGQLTVGEMRTILGMLQS